VNKAMHDHVINEVDPVMFAKSIPNIFTIGNLFLGILSIILVFNGEAGRGALLVLIAMMLDGLDGRVARALNVQSEFGKELDSLSDVISFGVAPAFIMYVIAFSDPTIISSGIAWMITAVFIICGALRLARFNVIEGTPGYFIGLPIPAAGGILCTLALFHKDLHPYILVLSTLLLSYLMISKVKYPNFKKTRIPKLAIWLTPILLGIAVVIAFRWPESISKMIFIPLLMYSLYGLKKNVNVILTRLRRVIRKKHLDKAIKTKS
jgi:CDP-diacylglycerol--serine O-phosphatidyltransferase